MQLIKKSKLYGQPTRDIRDYLRYVGTGTFDEADLRTSLEISADETQTVLAGLLADSYIGHAPSREGVPMYGLTVKGRQLAAAKFATQISRSVGENLLAGVLARAAAEEAQSEFVFRVTKIAGRWMPTARTVRAA